MLSTTAPFPYPGSTALYAGRAWRVLRHHRDGTALLGAADNDSHAMAAPLGDLVDPDLDAVDTAGLDERQLRQLSWLRAQLRTANRVEFASLLAALVTAARAGEVPTADGLALAGLLRRMGWERAHLIHRNAARISIWQRTSAHGAAA